MLLNQWPIDSSPGAQPELGMNCGSKDHHSRITQFLSRKKGDTLAEKSAWYQDIRNIHDRYFHESWQIHVDAINNRYQLSGGHVLLTHGPGMPMPWFNGDVESVEPWNWALVVSLNHQIDSDPPDPSASHPSRSDRKDDWWNKRRTNNIDRWYGKFFGPLVRVAAAAMQERVSRDQEPMFATKRMIFVEICPYVSNKFSLSGTAVKELVASDLGFQLASKVNRVFIDKGEPALLIINGNGAMEVFQHLYADALNWREVRYDSCDPPREGREHKRLSHYCGTLSTGNRSTPVVAFPFLRTPSSHNSNEEVALLGKHALRCVRPLVSEVSAESSCLQPPEIDITLLPERSPSGI